MNQIELEREVLIRAVLNKDYEYILNKFVPLKRANLIGIPIDQHDVCCILKVVHYSANCC